MMSQPHIEQLVGRPSGGAPHVEPGRATRDASAGDAAGPLGLVLSGGGARAAYQVGVLRGLTRWLPDLRFDVVTGVSAGALNAIYPAARVGPPPPDVGGLEGGWRRPAPGDGVRGGAAAPRPSGAP